MRHRASRERLNAKPAHAKMMRRNLVTSMFLYESLRTTRSRAKVLQPVVDRLITIAKKKPAHVAIRAINAVVTDKNASRKIMEVYKSRFADRPSGFTRIKPAGARKGDGAELVDITFVEGKEPAPAAPAAKKEASKDSKTSSKK